MNERRAGILLHPTSLPGGDVGTLGAAAHDFARFLARCGTSIWQILPLQPVGVGDSPYAGTSAFAGNTLLIAHPGAATEHAPAVDYDATRRRSDEHLRDATDRILADAVERSAFEAYCQLEAEWLDDYVLFATAREAYEGRPWTEWPAAIRDRESSAIAAFRREHAAAIARHAVGQMLFDRQWAAVRASMHGHGVAILGDIPIFVAHDSADVWSRRDLFLLDDAGQPTAVAGVPPDYFSPTGQLWGNPLYDWGALARTDYAWWTARLRRTLSHVDLIRLDHFRGFAAYWSIPSDAPTAESGHWVRGPGVDLFRAMERALGRSLPIVAEDLGTITPDVHALREELGYPGMRILQFAFGDDARNPYLPHNHERTTAVYTGTHDNDTTVSWFATIGEQERHRVRSYLGVDGADIAWELTRAALASVANLAIVPMQDLLSLDASGRMNTPGRLGGNWSWRLTPDQLNDGVADRFRDLVTLYGRRLAINNGQENPK
ncbi:MAG: 4-alpha-glucanotransferase [Chloroflexota bacterium]|nr:MAG: 4-alpha-glucanotransferase [Chloroflexota bacterium]